MKHLFLFFLCLLLPLAADEQRKRETLFASLNPVSISEALAFYELYPHSPEGNRALARAWQLLQGEKGEERLCDTLPLHLSKAFEGLLALIQRNKESPLPTLTAETLDLIERLSGGLKNRELPGCRACSEQEIVALPSEAIALSRGLLLSQLGEGEDLRTYEALLDLMALQILTRVSFESPPLEKVRAINAFIFEEMGFRFPPHALYAKDIDVYTFLPSVLDGHWGVCLGVTTLYLCLAERVGLPLEVVTPPGHIYVRYVDDSGLETNIETTARGIHLPTEEYLGLQRKSLSQKTLKEVIGCTHFNQASVYMQRKEYARAVASYRRAAVYMRNDPLLEELLGFNLLFAGEVEEGREVLRRVKDVVQEGGLVQENLASDYLEGRADIEALRAVFLAIDETRESILEKQRELLSAVARHPHFRGGLFHLAVTYLQLHRPKEALAYLVRFHEEDATDPVVEYYLAMLYADRRDFPSAWRHFRCAEALVQAQGCYPKPLRALKRDLRLAAPA